MQNEYTAIGKVDGMTEFLVDSLGGDTPVSPFYVVFGTLNGRLLAQPFLDEDKATAFFYEYCMKVDGIQLEEVQIVDGVLRSNDVLLQMKAMR